ncbi:MAG TPA: nuclear transport factor 2 family protein [Candidatus Limnocylindrales bacterium]|nr:nuclear transport factor 2 family protein [Candidatus Limnocylindrales bacterium]
MMRFVALLLPLLVLIVALPACGKHGMDETIQSAAVRSTLDTLWTQYADAADRRDSLLFGTLFHEDAALAYSSAPTVTGRGAIQQFLFTLYSGVDLTRLRVAPEDMVVNGTLAAQGGSFEEDYLDNTTPKTEVGRYELIAQRGDDERWRIHRLVVVVDSLHVSH